MALTDDAADRKFQLSVATQHAKRAVEFDPKDGLSWSILGNAYLSEFFCGSQNHSCALHAIKAYKQAVSVDYYFLLLTTMSMY